MKIKKKLVAILLCIISLFSIIAVNADGGGGAGGGGTAGIGYALENGIAHVWFDRGGWNDPDQLGNNKQPVQGCYYLTEKLSQEKTGMSKQQNLDIMINRFISELNREIGYQADRTLFKKQWNQFYSHIERACINAIRRSGNNKV